LNIAELVDKPFYSFPLNEDLRYRQYLNLSVLLLL